MQTDEQEMLPPRCSRLHYDMADLIIIATRAGHLKCACPSLASATSVAVATDAFNKGSTVIATKWTGKWALKRVLPETAIGLSSLGFTYSSQLSRDVPVSSQTSGSPKVHFNRMSTVYYSRCQARSVTLPWFRVTNNQFVGSKHAASQLPDTSMPFM